MSLQREDSALKDTQSKWNSSSLLDDKAYMIMKVHGFIRKLNHKTNKNVFVSRQPSPTYSNKVCDISYFM